MPGTQYYTHQPHLVHGSSYMQGKKKVRKLQKPGTKTTGQQKARRGDKPVASEKTTKEVPPHRGQDVCHLSFALRTICHKRLYPSNKHRLLYEGAEDI